MGTRSAQARAHWRFSEAGIASQGARVCWELVGRLGGLAVNKGQCGWCRGGRGRGQG